MAEIPDKIDYEASDLPPGVEVGAVIAGKYQLEALIGMGGMGSVWRATHLGLNQHVAVKIVSPDFARSAEARRRFDVEAKSAAQLRSRHVVQVSDNGELADGTPFMAMELLQGEPLGKRIHKFGPLPILDALRVTIHVGRALARAHALGIVHRDIKPENIFLATSDEEPGYIAKVLDFGIAKVKATNSGDQSATRTGSLLGTPLYMSPEQARALKTVDHRSDVYSLGLVVYTMLTGNLAFSGESYADVIVQICTMPLPEIRASAPWVPDHVDTWLTHACAKEQQNRYQDVQSMVDALCVAAGYPPGSPELAAPIGAGQPANPYAGTMPVAPNRDDVLGRGSQWGSSQGPAGQSSGGFAAVPPRVSQSSGGFAAVPQIGRAQSSGGFASVPSQIGRAQSSGGFAAVPQHLSQMDLNAPIPVGTLPMTGGGYQAPPPPPQTSAPWTAPAPTYTGSGTTGVEVPRSSNAPWIILLVVLLLGGGGAGLYFGVLADNGKASGSSGDTKKKKDKDDDKDDKSKPAPDDTAKDKGKDDKPDPKPSVAPSVASSAPKVDPPKPDPGKIGKPVPPVAPSVGVPTPPVTKPSTKPTGPDLGF